MQGGADQGMPIIVSRVAPNTPADLAIPRLNEGDQVLYINGRDVSQHTHEQVSSGKKNIEDESHFILNTPIDRAIWETKYIQMNM